jgi:hypothetical protein
MLFDIFHVMSTSLPAFDAERRQLAGLDLRLDCLIGNGRHGTVFAAHRGNGDGTVAVKIPVTGTLAHEAETLRRFAHPGVVVLLEGPLSNGAIITELCTDGTLAAALAADGVQPGAVVASWLIPIVDAVSHMHDDGWIHGDINPTNIGLRADGSAVLLDFATARIADATPLTQGTTRYLGEIRTAVTTVDVRALATTVLDAAANGPVRSAASDIVRRVDAGAVVDIADLAHILSDATDSTAGDRPAPGTRALPPGGTQDFGPRPGGRPQPIVTTASLRPLMIVAIMLGVALVGFSGERSTAPPEADRNPPQMIAAADTLTANQIGWRNGLLERTARTRDTHWSVGQSDDQAAVGDWDCDGSQTLGVYRPATGEWFAFDSWAENSQSTVAAGFRLDGSLFVEHNNGCDRPVVRG